VLIVSGNYAWLNWLTVVLAASAFSDGWLAAVLPVAAPSLAPRPFVFDWLLAALGLATLLLSIKPTLNFFAKRQAMNATYNPLHLLGSYGAFGSVTRERHEIVLEGTLDEHVSEGSQWREYELPGKPGDPQQRPRQWAPYHLRLDWLMWFLPLRVVITRSGLKTWGHAVWFVRLVEKLLEADPTTLALLRDNPFPNGAPSHIRARFYHYELASPQERKRSGAHWKRTYLGEYLPALSRQQAAAQLAHGA
jgi:hypothetical protein